MRDPRRRMSFGDFYEISALEKAREDLDRLRAELLAEHPASAEAGPVVPRTSPPPRTASFVLPAVPCNSPIHASSSAPPHRARGAALALAAQRVTLKPKGAQRRSLLSRSASGGGVRKPRAHHLAHLRHAGAALGDGDPPALRRLALRGPEGSPLEPAEGKLQAAAAPPARGPGRLVEKLNLPGVYQEVLQREDIDVDALGLMGEKDMEEIGVPLGPALRLLTTARAMRHEFGPILLGRPRSLRELLATLRLGHIEATLAARGVESLAALRKLTPRDLRDLGVTLGGRLKRADAVRRLAYAS